MAKDSYTLKVNEDTGEQHLFKGEMLPRDPKYKCSSQRLSICEKMKKENSSGNKFGCLNEDEARIECAKIGREVCGTCVSHLYASYDS
nr:hypothetical protein [Halomonas socia]